MKLTFKNLGTIKETTLDLRPLTVIVGPNNTSKTYLAYCVHGMLSAIAGRMSLIGDLPPGDAQHTLHLDEIVGFMRSVADDLLAPFERALPEFFQDSYGSLFEKTRLRVSPDESDVRAALQKLAAATDGRLQLTANEVILRSRPVRRNDPTHGPHVSVGAAAWHELARLPMTFPAERNAFVIAYKLLSARRYRLLRDRDRQIAFSLPARTKGRARVSQLVLPLGQTDIRYPAPIEEFLDFLTDVDLDASRPLNDENSPFGKLANLIESQIQGGHRTGYTQTKLGGSELSLTVSDKLRIDLYNASSSIKQLAPLLLYLRYRAAPNQMLIIDEPEMNLHPEGQAKLLEALAMLANLGVHVLLTTHSPYFMAHLNSLIAADPKSKARKARQAKHLYMGDPAAFLSPADVSAYEMRTEGLVSLADPEYGIRWDTLSDVSAELQRRYFAIVEDPRGRTKAK